MSIPITVHVFKYYRDAKWLEKNFTDFGYKKKGHHWFSGMYGDFIIVSASDCVKKCAGLRIKELKVHCNLPEIDLNFLRIRIGR